MTLTQMHKSPNSLIALRSFVLTVTEMMAIFEEETVLPVTVTADTPVDDTLAWTLS